MGSLALCRNTSSGPNTMKYGKHLLLVVMGLPFFGGALTVAAPSPGDGTDVGSWRATALKQHDADHDGRLSDAEREAMRQQVFTERRRSSGRGRGMMFPPEIVAKYDKDGDGSLDEAEGQAAQQALMKIFQDLQKQYDDNRNGNFEPPEVEKMKADAAAGKLEHVPKFFFQMFGRQGRRPRSDRPAAAGESGGELDLRQQDKDGDGRLNVEELKAARAALESSRQRNSPPLPKSPR
jgi:hypothetical protein